MWLVGAMMYLIVSFAVVLDFYDAVPGLVEAVIGL
jgi:hypothetical protein